MIYRATDDGPLTSIAVQRGRIVIDLRFDLPGCSTKLHAHTFDHMMTCLSGAARVSIDDESRTMVAGDTYLVAAHKQHAIVPLSIETVLQCVHENPDIDERGLEGIPLEWLRRLTE